jgi:hypothetical protein
MLLKSRLAAKKDSKTEVTTEREVHNLITYHRDALANFQQERALHLKVTLFFAGLVVFCFTGTGVLLNNFPPDWNSFQSFSLTHLPADLFFFALIFLLDLIIFALALAYLRHYYKLENGVQKLYELNQKLYELTLR